MVNHRNHIFHKFLAKMSKKSATFFMGTLLFHILQNIVLLDHVYSPCLQNVATYTKNKTFSGFGPWPKIGRVNMTPKSLNFNDHVICLSPTFTDNPLNMIYYKIIMFHNKRKCLI